MRARCSFCGIEEDVRGTSEFHLCFDCAGLQERVWLGRIEQEKRDKLIEGEQR